MRVTHQMMANSMVVHMQENLDRMNSLNEKIASTKKFQLPSDDPAAASASFSLRSSIRLADGYKETGTLSRDWLEANEFALNEMGDLADRAEQLILRGLNDSLDTSERQSALGKEMEEIIGRVLESANSQQNGHYIFSGFQVDTKPYTITGGNTVNFNGDNNIIQRDVAPGQTVDLSIDGETQFTALLNGLIHARDALNDPNYTDAALRNALGEVKLSINNVAQLQSVTGARLRQVDNAIDHMDRTQIEMKSLLSEKEDTDLAEAITVLRQQETTYQSVLEVGQRAISALNLFELLR